MRLNKYIANAGITSRRKADELIADGRVTINGEVVKEMGVKVEPKDEVHVDGERITVPEDKTIIGMYKPRGVVTTMGDAHAKKTVSDILPAEYAHLKPVGRLDKESEGLLLFTNDGELHQRLTHPSFEHEKEYYIEVEQPINDEQLQQLHSGVQLEEGIAAAKAVHRVGKQSFTITLTQGWNRQIRRMVAAVQNSVTLLKRVRIESLHLQDTMKPGDTKEINENDIFNA